MSTEIEERVKVLMKRGWNIHIECLSIDRDNAMTYEARALRTRGNYDAVVAHGSTLSSLFDMLELFIEDKELKGGE